MEIRAEINDREYNLNRYLKAKHIINHQDSPQNGFTKNTFLFNHHPVVWPNCLIIHLHVEPQSLKLLLLQCDTTFHPV